MTTICCLFAFAFAPMYVYGLKLKYECIEMSDAMDARLSSNRHLLLRIRIKPCARKARYPFQLEYPFSSSKFGILLEEEHERVSVMATEGGEPLKPFTLPNGEPDIARLSAAIAIIQSCQTSGWKRWNSPVVGFPAVPPRKK